MTYRVNTNGTIETDTAEEALELAALLDRKKYGKRPNADSGVKPVTGTKTRTRRRGKAKTRTAAGGKRRPSKAVEYQVQLGQVWEKHKGGSSTGRVIQIDKLLQDGVIPKIVKDGPDIKRKGIVKKISYVVLRNAYKLIKDV
jgi:hypothetical protein